MSLPKAHAQIVPFGTFSYQGVLVMGSPEAQEAGKEKTRRPHYRLPEHTGGFTSSEITFHDQTIWLFKSLSR